MEKNGIGMMVGIGIGFFMALDPDADPDDC
jgi:hypothetical protein